MQVNSTKNNVYDFNDADIFLLEPKGYVGLGRVGLFYCFKTLWYLLFITFVRSTLHIWTRVSIVKTAAIYCTLRM
jgi:hypothetical protein